MNCSLALMKMPSQQLEWPPEMDLDLDLDLDLRLGPGPLVVRKMKASSYRRHSGKGIGIMSVHSSWGWTASAWDHSHDGRWRREREVDGFPSSDFPDPDLRLACWIGDPSAIFYEPESR